MRRSNTILLLCLLCWGVGHLHAQTLKVELSPDKSKVDRSVSNGTATIFFDSNVNELSIVSTDQNPDEQIQRIGDKFWVMHVNPKKDIELDNVCYRSFRLNSPSSAEYQLTTPEIGYNQVLYYTVILPDRFPSTISAEWLISGATGKGFRIGYGKRYGVYFSYKWGKYKPSGNNISDIMEDCNLSSAKELGYIRESYIVGARIGLFQYKWCQAFALIGGGYGKYGRQWQNPTKVGDNIYFYSDYIKGFNGNVAFSFVLTNSYTISIGTDIILSKGKTNMDFELGIGYGFTTTNWFKHKKKGKK